MEKQKLSRTFFHYWADGPRNIDNISSPFEVRNIVVFYDSSCISSEVPMTRKKIFKLKAAIDDLINVFLCLCPVMAGYLYNAHKPKE